MEVEPDDAFVVGGRTVVARQPVKRPGGEFLRQRPEPSDTWDVRPWSDRGTVRILTERGRPAAVVAPRPRESQRAARSPTAGGPS